MEVNDEDTNQPDGIATARSPLKKNKCKDEINIDAAKLPGSSPKARKGAKAHPGGDENYRYNKADKGQESGDKTEHIINSDEEEEAISKSQRIPASGDERQKCYDFGSETEKSLVSGSETGKSRVSGSEMILDLNAILDPKTEKSRVSSQKTEEGPVSGTNQDLIIGKHYIVLAIVVIIIALVWYSDMFARPDSLQKDYNLLQVFSHEMEKVQSSFPSQRHELWKRTNIHLKRHLNLTNPLEPVSLILTSGQGAEKTLSCLAKHLATAFSAALNSSVLGIDGTSKTAQDSDQVKLSVDEELEKAFEGGTQAAVIHNFEEFPPGSTLIFYRYCDHENAAYKKVLLVFTVMLPVTEINSELSLREVEEQVQEYLKERFVSARTATFNDMDVDKLSGLWSRISHLILPVAAEQNFEQKGCMNLK